MSRLRTLVICLALTGGAFLALAANVGLMFDNAATPADGTLLQYDATTGLAVEGPAAATLSDIAGLAVTDGNIIVGDGTNWVAESGTTARTSLGLAIGTNVQAWDADLDTWAGVTPSANGQSLVSAATYAAMKALLDLEIGTDVQAYHASLADIAGLAKTDGNIIVGDGANWVAESGATARTSLGLTIGTNVQAFHAYLADIAAIVPAKGDMIYFDGTDWVKVDASGAAQDDVPAVQADGSIAFQAQAGASIVGATYTLPFTIPLDAGTIGHPAFTGAGVNDMFTSGTYASANSLTYVVEIDAEAIPDTFKWSDDGGSTWDVATVAITGSAQTLNNGVQIKFLATTGHTLGNKWTFVTTGGETGDLQFEIQIDDSADFASPIEENDSRDAGDGGDGQTGCEYSNGTAFVAWPASGGTGAGVARAYHGNSGSYTFTNASIEQGTHYYWRVRFHNGSAWGDWSLRTHSW